MTRFDHLNVIRTEPLPSPYDLIQELPLTLAQKKFIHDSRLEIQRILDGEDPRLLIIVGPCSVHDIKAAKHYATKLHQLSQSVSDKFLLVMRAYFEKPRTSRGWKGFLYDPMLNGSHDILTGLKWTRQLLLDLADIGVPAAAEFLDPSSAYYFGDLLSWGCIGARTSASQTHRQIASGLQMPVAFKNSTDGNVETAINGIISAAVPHSFIGINEHGRVSTVHTSGNTYGHVVLRGGEGQPNYDPKAISEALELLNKAKLPSRLLIDCSHDNSYRQHEQQSVVFQSIIKQLIEGNRNIRGALIESHLEAGNQPFVADPSQLKYAVSLTDPCLNWIATEKLLLWGHSMLTLENEQLDDSSSVQEELFTYMHLKSSKPFCRPLS
jgi:3-deoxy-7-phosphoheptulonate synthase